MAAGNEREALAEFANRLCAEFGYGASGDLPDGVPSHLDETRTYLFAGLLSPEEERLVATARRSLAHFAAGLVAEHPQAVSETVLRALLDGAELMMRGELAAGNTISPLMPSFVYLIALPMVKQDEALELSDRTTSLLATGKGIE
jgi:hypothetical protein